MKSDARPSTLISATCSVAAEHAGMVVDPALVLGLRIDLIELPPRKPPMKHKVGNPDRNQEQKKRRLDDEQDRHQRQRLGQLWSTVRVRAETARNVSFGAVLRASQRVVEVRILEAGKSHRIRVPQNVEVQAIVEIDLESPGEIAGGGIARRPCPRSSRVPAAATDRRLPA